MVTNRILKIFVKNSDLKKKYINSILEHNNSMSSNPYPNCGFDLFIPNDTTIGGIESKFVYMDIKCEMTDSSDSKCGFFMFPRSSISHTPLVLSNHVGIIDSGYRGEIIAAFRNLSTNSYDIMANTRLVQICHPSLSPFLIQLVENEEELSNTIRGDGGFGSTGK
jgi:dUTP pyrophosphatase